MSPTRNSFSGLKFSIEASVVVAAAYGARRGGRSRAGAGWRRGPISILTTERPLEGT
jgi:hypothetical protein